MHFHRPARLSADLGFLGESSDHEVRRVIDEAIPNREHRQRCHRPDPDEAYARSPGGDCSPRTALGGTRR